MIKIYSHLNKIFIVMITISLSFFVVIYVNHISLYGDIPKIYIKGLDYIDEQSILSSIADQNFSLYNYNISSLKNIIEQIEYVKSAKISFLLPNIFIIQIVERYPIFMIADGNYKVFYDTYGKQLKVNSKSINHFPVPIVTYKERQHLEHIGTNETLNVMNEIFRNNSYLYDGISEVIIKKDFITLITDEYTKIILNDNLLVDQLGILYSFEKTINHIKNINDYEYIDLSVKNKIIVKEKNHG